MSSRRTLPLASSPVSPLDSPTPPDAHSSPPAPPQAFPDPIPNVIRFGSVNLWSGASGAGKTIMLAEWFARMRDGRPIWYKPTTCPTAFYVLAADRDWSTYAEAFRDAGFPDVNHYVLAEDTTENPSGWKPEEALKLYETCMDKLNPIPGSFVYVDPLSPLFIRGSQNDARNCAVTLHWIRRSGRTRQITQILSSNTIKISADAKSGYQRRRDNISGSGALVAYSDTSIYTEPPLETGGPTLIGWAPRRAPEEVFSCQFDPATRLFVPYTSLEAVGQTAETDRPTQLLVLVPADGISTSELIDLAMQQFRISDSTVKRDIRELVTRQLLERDEWGHLKRRKVN